MGEMNVSFFYAISEQRQLAPFVVPVLDEQARQETWGWESASGMFGFLPGTAGSNVSDG